MARNQQPQAGRTAIPHPFAIPTDHTRDLANTALIALRQMVKPGILYNKAGVMLQSISQKRHRNGELFDVPQVPATPKSAALTAVLDKTNQKYGRGRMGFGVVEKPQAWDIRRSMCSPCWTNNWKELPVAR